ncbi:MAG: hypothetical protein WAO00_16960 [Chthoniobacterales bacterium]
MCDEFALTVSGLSAATTTSRYIRIEVRWPEAGETQFDLYVFEGTTATGHIIAKNLSNQTYVDPDVVLIPALNGECTIRVAPFLPNGQSIAGTVSLVSLPAAASVEPGTAPTSSNHLSPANLGNSAGEPSIGVDQVMLQLPNPGSPVRPSASTLPSSRAITAMATRLLQLKNLKRNKVAPSRRPLLEKLSRISFHELQTTISILSSQLSM